MSEGDELDIFDGVGGLYRCRLCHAHQRRAKIEVVEGHPPVPRPANAPSLAIALLKGQAMDRAIQQATELGTQNIWLLQGARSNLSLKQDRLAQKLDHWQRIIASASEQCGQLWLPSLHAPRTVAACLEEQPDHVKPIVFEPTGDVMPPQLEVNNPLIFVGPEGGWNDEENSCSEANISQYRLRPYHCPGRNYVSGWTCLSAAGPRLAKLIGQPLRSSFTVWLAYLGKQTKTSRLDYLPPPRGP